MNLLELTQNPSDERACEEHLIQLRWKHGVSAKTLQRHIVVSYDTAWHMLHKIRNTMAERNAKYKLEGIVQVDDFYLGGRSP